MGLDNVLRFSFEEVLNFEPRSRIHVTLAVVRGVKHEIY